MDVRTVPKKNSEYKMIQTRQCTIVMGQITLNIADHKRKGTPKDILEDFQGESQQLTPSGADLYFEEWWIGCKEDVPEPSAVNRSHNISVPYMIYISRSIPVADINLEIQEALNQLTKKKSQR